MGIYLKSEMAGVGSYEHPRKVARVTRTGGKGCGSRGYVTPAAVLPAAQSSHDAGNHGASNHTLRSTVFC